MLSGIILVVYFLLKNNKRSIDKEVQPVPQSPIIHNRTQNSTTNYKEKKDLDFGGKLYVHPDKMRIAEFRNYVNSLTSSEANDYLSACNAEPLNLREKFFVLVEKAGLEDEQHILDTIQILEPHEIDPFIKQSKKDGIYFTNKAYDAAMAKKNSIKNKQTLELIESMTPLSVIKWYLKNQFTEGFNYLDKEALEAVHRKTLQLFEDKEIPNKLHIDLFYYLKNTKLKIDEKVYRSTSYQLFLNNLSQDSREDIKALSFRWLGELSERNKDYETAISHFEKALEINPKIGVMQKMKRLKKNI